MAIRMVPCRLCWVCYAVVKRENADCGPTSTHLTPDEREDEAPDAGLVPHPHGFCVSAY